MTPPTLLDFESALTLLRAHAHTVTPPASTETLPLAQSLDRVLAAPVQAQRDQPPFDRATRDGFAVHSLDFSATRTAQLVGQLKAGDACRVHRFNPAMRSRS